MYICYFDETGDDGYPQYSSELFVLTSVYMHFQNWKSNFEKIHAFRVKLKEDYNFPVKFEFHTKYFLTDKNPYRDLGLTNQQRKEILFLYFDLIGILDLKVINVVINKNNVKSDDYDVLDHALTYNIQRIENDLKAKSSEHRFLIITDEGRLSKMTATTRKIQKINYIPSKFNQGNYRSEIGKMIEDPLPKRSTESYFIQLSDMISYVVHLYFTKEHLKKEWPKRVLSMLDYEDSKLLLNKLKNSETLNLKAAPNNEFGIVFYPK